MVTKQKVATTFGADWHTSTTTETESNQLAASFVDQVQSIRQQVPCTQSQSVSQSPREERHMVMKVSTHGWWRYWIGCWNFLKSHVTQHNTKLVHAAAPPNVALAGRTYDRAVTYYHDAWRSTRGSGGQACDPPRRRWEGVSGHGPRC